MDPPWDLGVLGFGGLGFAVTGAEAVFAGFRIGCHTYYLEVPWVAVRFKGSYKGSIRGPIKGEKRGHTWRFQCVAISGVISPLILVITLATGRNNTLKRRSYVHGITEGVSPEAQAACHVSFRRHPGRPPTLPQAKPMPKPKPQRKAKAASNAWAKSSSCTRVPSLLLMI